MAVENIRKKINDIDEIWDGNKLKTRDFSNLDLEGLNLAIIPEKAWYGCKFYNTNAKNTGIKLLLSSIKGNSNIVHTVFPHRIVFTYEIIEGCDFSDNNLTPLTTWNDTITEYPLFYSCDFTNTSIDKNIYGKNNKLDKKFTIWKNVNFADFGVSFPEEGRLDLDTLKNNPQLNIDTEGLLKTIKLYLFSDCKCSDEEKVNNIGEYLNFDSDGKYLKLYNALKKYLEDNEIVFFFKHYYFSNTKFKNISFAAEDLDILNRIKFCGCEFENLLLGNTIDELVNINSSVFDSGNTFQNLITPNVNYSSWQAKPSQKNRLSKSPATFRTNLYLELGRLCNARCEFCRNSYYCDNTYDFESIKETLYDVIPKLDSIVIGGGEPTLRLYDLKRLILNSLIRIHENNVSLYLFTNGSHKYIDKELNTYNFKYNISRHAIDDEENAAIFKLPTKSILSTEELKSFIYNNPKTTLAATCFKGALDSNQKIIDYIKYATSIGCKSILFSDLIVMEDELLKIKENYNFNIDCKVFDNVILYLEKNGYEKSIPIYATGGYILTMLKKDGINISFKHYISKNHLEENWQKAVKRTFDLSIDPKGDLYENWHQTSGHVKIKKYK